jgi:hypothetical protein
MTTGREEREYVRAEYGMGTRPEGAEARLREEGERAQHRAREQGEELKQNVAGGLHTAAETIREQAGQRGRQDLGTRVADPLDRSAQYLSTHSLPQMRDDAMRTAQEHPLWTAAGVFATAFLVGRLLRRR